MPYNIQVTMTAQIGSGAAVSVPRTIAVDAYDTIEVALAAAAAAANPTKATVDVQPSGQGKVKFLLVRSSLYDAHLTFKVDAGATAIVLDQPLLLAGQGAVGLLGATQNKFAFENATDKVASIEILVGREAIV